MFAAADSATWARYDCKWIEVIEGYVEEHNKEPKPFIRTAKAQDIIERVSRARAALNKIASE